MHADTKGVHKYAGIYSAQHAVYISRFCTCIQSAVEKSFRKSFNERGEELMARNSIDGSESVVSLYIPTYVQLPMKTREIVCVQSTEIL